MPQTVILCLDLGGTTLSGGLVQPDGRIRLRRALPTFARARGEAVLEQFLDMASRLLDAARQRRLKVAGIVRGGSMLGGQDGVEQFDRLGPVRPVAMHQKRHDNAVQ